MCQPRRHLSQMHTTNYVQGRILEFAKGGAGPSHPLSLPFFSPFSLSLPFPSPLEGPLKPARGSGAAL